MKRSAGSYRTLALLLAGVIIGIPAITLLRLRAVPPVPAVPPPAPGPAPAPPPIPGEASFSFSDSRLSGAKEAFLRHDFNTAFRLCETARQQGAATSAVCEMEASLFKETGYLDREIETLKKWASAAPKDVHPWLKLFYIYLDLGWRHEADAASRRALELDPQNGRSHVARALFYYRSNSAELGIKSIEEACRLTPANPEWINLQESILLKARRYSEAEALARKTLTAAPQQTQEQLILVHALLGQNRAQEADTILQEILKREPENVEAAYETGAEAQKRGDRAEATRQFEKVVSLDPQFNNALWRLGHLYALQGQAEKGQQLLKTFERLDRNTTEYETALNRLQAHPDDPQIHYRLAQYHLAAEEMPQAIVELRRTLELRPADTKAREDLIHALNRHGRVTEARQVASVGAERSGNP